MRTAARHLAAAPAVAVVAVLAGSPLPAIPGNPEPDQAAGELETRYWDSVEPLLARHCFGCHGEEAAKGGVRFDRVWTLADALDMGDHLALAADLMRSGQMPPDSEPRPTPGEVEIVSSWIRDALDYVPADGAVDPGWFIIHRLNRSEYRATMRDLLGIDPAGHDLAAGLPQDDTGYGYDNIAAVLSVSPLQIEAYLDAAERALDLALGPVVAESDRAVPLRDLTPTGGGRGLAKGGILLYSNGAASATARIAAPGEYEISVVAWGQRGGDDLPRLSLRVDGREVLGSAVEGLEGTPQTFRARVRLEPGDRLLAAHFTNDYYRAGEADRNLAIESVSLAGPLPGTLVRPPTRAGLLFDEPADGSVEAGRASATRVLERFASRAFRRPVTPAELDGLLGLYDRARRTGDDHEHGVRVAMTAVLVSPNFLYRSVGNPRPDDPGSVYTLSGPELATRLSYFLWSSMPDEELAGLAASGAIHDDGVLAGQVRRMLADPKADAFIEQFAGQWLHLRNLERLQIDRGRFPAYGPELRAAMIAEAVLFFGDVVRQGRSALTLIDSDHTFVNGPLATLYGFADLAGIGPEFRRVELPEGSPRGGVLTMGAVLAVTSNPTRTSPVKRGLWVLDQILGTPPPPPPPETPPLEQAQAALPENPTPRDLLSAHLIDPNCAVCHVRMDPIGLALENFDAIGAWRDADESGPIDASGVLPEGVRFVGPEELKGVLLGRSDRFLANLTHELLTYALGRGVEPFDRPTVDRIVRRAHERGDSVAALIEGIVLSDAFRTCRGVRR